MSDLQIWRPRDLPSEFAALNNAHLNTYAYLRTFANQFAATQRAQIALNDEVTLMIREIGNRFVATDGISFAFIYHLDWRLDFYQVFSEHGKTSQGVFVTLTGVVNGFKHPRFAEWVALQSLDPSSLCDGVACVRGFWLTRGWNAISERAVDFSELVHALDAQPSWKPEYRISPEWALLIKNSLYSFLAEKKEQVVSEQENNGIKFYTRAQLEEYLRAHSANDELVENLKFVDEKTTMWSKHLVLNTHKKQTTDTPRYSIENGPGILTITLERSDLDEGERAPKLQMIFADYNEGGIAVRPRIEGGMVTHRMLDSFEQITKELQAGVPVVFTTLEQIVTFVTHVADEGSTVTGFRQELGDPQQALIEAGVPNPAVYFRMQKKEDGIVEVEALGRGDPGEDDTVLKQLVLSVEVHNGGFALGITRETLLASIERGKALSERTEAWQEVRGVEPTPDEAVGTTTEEARALLARAEELVEAQSPSTVLVENALDNIVHAQPIRALKDVEVAGNDEYMLDHFIERLLVSLISMRDKRALMAFRHYILDGEGLANVDNWGFHAALVREGAKRAEHSFLRDGNNAYIAIYDRAIKLGSQQALALAIYQCKVDVE